MRTESKHNGPQHKRQNEDRTSTPQDQIFFDLLKEFTLTASQIEALTGIKQKNLCWYKRAFQKEGRLWQVKYVRCPITTRWAWTLTTNPAKVEIHSKQLNLFEDGI